MRCAALPIYLFEVGEDTLTFQSEFRDDLQPFLRQASTASGTWDMHRSHRPWDMRLAELKEMVKYIMLCNALVLWGGTSDALADVPSWWTQKSMGFRRVWVITVMGYDRTVDSNLQNPGISLVLGT